MSLDGIYLQALISEWRKLLAGARVNRIVQYHERLLGLELYRSSKTRLVFSLHPKMLGACLTDWELPRPDNPSPFCMLLRKYCEGSRLIAIDSHGCDRWAKFTFERPDELGDRRRVHLIAEWFGGRSNLFLVRENHTILGSMMPLAGADAEPGMTTHGAENGERRRTPLIGGRYDPPAPGRGRLPITDIAADGMIILQQSPLQEAHEISVWKWLVNRVCGPGPLLCRSLASSCGIEADRAASSLSREEIACLERSLADLAASVLREEFHPVLIEDVRAFSAYPIAGIPKEHQQNFASANRLLNRVMYGFWFERHLDEKAKKLLKKVKSQIRRLEKRIAMRNQELAESQDAEHWKLQGELLLANLHTIQPGQSRATVLNYHDERMPEVTITLDPALSPVENAKRCFHRYNKTRRRREVLDALLQEDRKELEYWQDVLLAVEQAEDTANLAEIEQELGIPKKGKATRSKKHLQPSGPMSFPLSDEWTLWVGRNNLQNDILTMKLAHRQDIWLHARGMPGSHGLLQHRDGTGENTEPAEEILEQAAEIIAYYSKGRSSTRVPVDYTRRKNVRKPRGARPGMVIYDSPATLDVTPRLPDRFRSGGGINASGE